MPEREQKRILVVDDDPMTARILAAELRSEGFGAITAGCAEDALELVDIVLPDAIVSDVVMPGLSGIDLVSKLRARAELAGIPFLLMSADGQPAERARAIQNGASDYLQKPVLGTELVARLRQQLSVASELRQLRRLSELDALTGLLNRRGIEVALDRALRESMCDESELSVMLLDVDRFKQVNDNFGHKEGDVLLRMIARKLSESIREQDMAGRLGGDEFVLLLPGCSHIAATHLGLRLEAAMQVFRDKYGLPVGLSFGIYSAHRGATAEQIIDSADRAMYVNKRASRAREVSGLVVSS